jgi:hypothetical protein
MLPPDVVAVAVVVVVVGVVVVDGLLGLLLICAEQIPIALKKNAVITINFVFMMSAA